MNENIIYCLSIYWVSKFQSCAVMRFRGHSKLNLTTILKSVRTLISCEMNCLNRIAWSTSSSVRCSSPHGKLFPSWSKIAWKKSLVTNRHLSYIQIFFRFISRLYLIMYKTTNIHWTQLFTTKLHYIGAGRHWCIELTSVARWHRVTLPWTKILNNL